MLCARRRRDMDRGWSEANGLVSCEKPLLEGGAGDFLISGVAGVVETMGKGVAEVLVPLV